MENNEEMQVNVENIPNETNVVQENATEFKPQDKKGISIAALVLGITSMVGWFISAGIVLVCGILAIIFGVFGRKNGPGAGKGMATAGLVLGIIAIALYALLTLLGVGLLAGTASALGSMM